MGPLTRTVVSIVALISALPIPGSGQNRDIRVVVVGTLEVYDTAGLICDQMVRDEARLSFLPDSQDLNFAGETRNFDPSCRWIGEGTLYQGEASLTINARYRDFVQSRPTEPIEIRNTDPDETLIRRIGIRVILYEKERYSSEMRDGANRAVRENDITRAMELYDVAFENLPDPETLFLKADALDHTGRYAEAASTWSQAFEIVSDEEAVGWRRAGDVPWRWTTSLYEAAEAATEPQPESWLNVAEASRDALDLQSPDRTNRPRIMATWLDSLFNAADARGDYSRLSEAIQSDQNMQNSWHGLFYQEFRDEAPPDSLSNEEIVQGIGELEAALGRKGGQR